MATLELKNIKKAYGDHEIIHDFSMEIHDGELIVFVGPSGCGKSTVLRMIAGLEEITSGELILDGKVINSLSPRRRDIAMVFQNYALYPHMTVYDNMAYGLKMRKFSKEQIKLQVDEAAKMLELDELLDRKPDQLSGGQRQRVAMGRAMVRHPAVFLFDEPLSNLDALLRVQMRLEIKKLQRKLNTTSIYVTHDQVEAMTLADRIVVLKKGVVQQIGTPLEVYEKPATMFVGSFIGSPAMNFLDAKISTDAKCVQIDEYTNLPLNYPSPLPPGTPVILGIRPETIREKTKPDMDFFDIIVNHIETLGANTLVYGHLPHSKQMVTARLHGQTRPRPGDQIRLGVLADHLHLFDVETKVRIHYKDH